MARASGKTCARPNSFPCGKGGRASHPISVPAGGLRELVSKRVSFQFSVLSGMLGIDLDYVLKLKSVWRGKEN